MAEYKSIYTGEEIDNALGKANTALQQETDPIFSASPVANVTSQDIANWNGKSDFSGSYNDLTDKPELFSGDYDDLTNKPSIPSSTSDLTNDSGFITNSVNNLVNYYLKNEVYTKDEVTALIGAIQQFHYEVVQELPQTGANNIMYLVPKSTSQTNNVYDEYVYSNGWEKIGDTEIDLSNYVTITMLNQALADYTTTANLTTLLAEKQDVIDSTHKLSADLVDDTNSTNKFFSGNYNDLTNKPTIPDELSDLTDDSTHRLVTDTEKTTWNGKQDLLTAGDNITITNNVISASGGAKTVIFNLGETTQERVAKAQEIYNDQINGKIDQIYLNDNKMIYEMNYEPFDTGFTVICHYFDERAGYNINLYGMKLYKITQVYATYLNSDPNNFVFTKNLHSYVFYDNNTLPLGIKNTTAYTPTGDYNPATKKYVDDSISTAVGSINTVLATLTTPSGNGGN